MGRPVYDSEHQRERRAVDARLVAAGPVPCRRCGRPVYADRQHQLNWDGRRFDLGHPDAGQAGKAAEHATCNRQAGGREGNRRKHEPASREW